MEDKIIDVIIAVGKGTVDIYEAPKIILSLIDENKNRLANEVQATKDSD